MWPHTVCDFTVVDQLTLKSVYTTFMEDVILTFRISAVVVIDEYRKFCRVFEEAIKALKITVCKISQGNHKGICAEKYPHFFKTKCKLLSVNTEAPICP